MKVGHRVKIANLDYFVGEYEDKRPKKLIGLTGKIVEMYLGVFKVEVGGKVIDCDGRELEVAEKLVKKTADFTFVSWQKNGKSVYDSKEGELLFAGDFHRGVTFKGGIELTEEEITRVMEAAEEGIVPVFDLKIHKSDRRQNRRKDKGQTE